MSIIRRRRPIAAALMLTLATASAAGLAGIVLSSSANAQPASQPAAAEGEKTVTASGLTIIERGRRDEAAKAGDRVSVLYTGSLDNGTVFDSTSRRNNQPFQFTLGARQVIAGWDEGVAGMHVGQKRTLIIPPELGYGAKGAGEGLIPPNATLHFDVEVVAIEPAATGR